ncbi:hypothetical protein ACFU3E_16940 [Streptomyces sp. NPDC057424]|uniref:hypothetical protein n=1 Tax=Streptomyces sp. NPDC057424 TaxID=3346127 RepID=UPI00369D9D49
MGGPLKKYRFTTGTGHETILKLSTADAELRGLSDDDLVGAEPADGQKAAVAPNKARATSSNKARSPRGKGGEGGGD